MTEKEKRDLRVRVMYASPDPWYESEEETVDDTENSIEQAEKIVGSKMEVPKEDLARFRNYKYKGEKFA